MANYNQRHQRSKSFYQETCERWRTEFFRKGRPVVDFGNIPSPVDSVLCCVKCGEPATDRHHKGNEFFLACINEDLYAERYIQFLPEDVARLCKDCHKEITFINRKIQDAITDTWTSNQLKDKATLEHWRQVFLSVYNAWLLTWEFQHGQETSRT